MAQEKAFCFFLCWVTHNCLTIEPFVVWANLVPTYLIIGLNDDDMGVTFAKNNLVIHYTLDVYNRVVVEVAFS